MSQALLLHSEKCKIKSQKLRLKGEAKSLGFSLFFILHFQQGLA
jgi:hypothetical protein